MSAVVLFGAGASYGSGDAIPERPPLGNWLFHELARCFPMSWGSLPNEAIALFQENFEQGMELVWEKWSTTVAQLMQHMAIYFVQFRPRNPGTSSYSKLVRAIIERNSQDRILLSTLNYDLLLELAICENGASVNYGTPSKDNITLWKLHGSCNFLPISISATRGVQFTRGVSFGTSIRETGDPNEVLEFCLGNNALPPAMCLFMRGKPVQVAPDSIVQLQKEWQRRVVAAAIVAVVGVHPNSDDSHIWQSLSETDAKLTYIGAQDPFEAWANEHRAGKESIHLGERFEESLEKLIKEVVI